MARSQAQIKATILAAIAADPVLGSLLTSTSQTAIYAELASINAYIENLLEQSWDDYLVQINTYASQTPAASTNWIAAQAFLYQYDASGASATNALTILSNGALGYLTINPSFNIVTRCAAIVTGNNSVQIKVAQGSTPTKITGTAFTQLQSYFDAKGTAGINYTVTSGNADSIVILGTVKFKAGYAGIAQQNVEAAIANYLNTIAIYSPTSQEPINYAGIIKVSEVIDAIMQADGVSDFSLSELYGYPDGATYPSGATTVYKLSASVNNNQYILQAGYGIFDGTNSSISYISA